MNLRRSAVSALLLLVATPAWAGTVHGRILHMVQDSYATGHTVRDRLQVAVPGGDAASVVAEVSSVAGKENVTLVESDTRLHGAAPLRALPATDATLALTVYDTASAALITYAGTLGADGSVSLAEDAPACDPNSRLGCTVTEAPDIELLGADVFAGPAGYELVVDLAGADAYDVAYAAIVVTEWRNGDECLEQRGSDGLCGSTDHLRTVSEVGWDTIDAVWEGEPSLVHDGAVDLKVKVRAEDGPSETLKSSLGRAWLDGDEGIGTLAADTDPLTTVGLLYGKEGARIRNVRSAQLAVVSEGWTLDTAPTHAAVELTTGETITIPANSYQRRKRPEMLTAEWDALIDEQLTPLTANPLFRLVIDGSTVTITGGDLTFADLSSPLCVEGTCVVLAEDDDGFALAVTQYRWDTAFIAGETNVSLTLLDASGAPVLTAEELVTFDDADVTVVFANDVDFGADPLGMGLSGRVSLLGAADARGRQSTLAAGRFYGKVARGGSGDLGLAGVGVDDIASMPATNFAVLLTGEPSVCGDDDDGWFAPPPLAAIAGNGSGTKAASSQTSTRPQLL